MSLEQVEKSIKQMRQVFGFIGVVNGIGVILNLANLANNGAGVFLLFAVIAGVYAWFFLTAFSELGKRSKKGYNFAKACSFLLIPGIVTIIFSISYLRKLSQPEMKQAFGN